jgi:hypothetical protein
MGSALSNLFSILLKAIHRHAMCYWIQRSKWYQLRTGSSFSKKGLCTYCALHRKQNVNANDEKYYIETRLKDSLVNF